MSISRRLIIAAAIAASWNAASAQTTARRLRFEDAPPPNSVVKGTLTVKVAADPTFQPPGVVYEVLLDGTSLTTLTPPAAVTWDTTTVTDGKHTLQLVRRIPAGGKSFRETFRDELPVLVVNSAHTAGTQNVSPQFAEVDRRALSATHDVEQTVDSLAAFLAQTARTDLEKTRAIYRWITGRVRWGPSEGVNPGQPMDARPEAVLSRRTAECLGYARLFEALARKAGLVAAAIQGYVRTDAATVEEYAADPARFNHWWNAVKLDGKWRLIDCGWSVRGQDGTTAGSAQGPVHLEPHYFLCPPAELIFTHFPLDPRWQVVDNPLPLDEQKALPYARTGLFDLGLSIESPRAGTFRAEGPFAVRINAPDDVVMAATLSQEGRQVSRVNASERQGGRYVFAFGRAAPGRYRLTLFAKRRSDPGAYTEVLAYTIEAR